MAITGTIYGNAYFGLGAGRFDFTRQPVYMALFTSSYVPDYNTPTTFQELLHGEVVGAGYTSGGMQITGITWHYTAGAATLTSNPIDFQVSGITCRYGVVYQYSTDPAYCFLLMCVDFGQNVSPTITPFPLSFPNGLFALSS